MGCIVAVKILFFDARVWRYSINAVSKIIEEAAFRVTEEGFRLKAIDASRVVLVDFNMPSSSFDEFSVEGEEVIGVNLEDLAKILRRATKEDRLELSTMEGGRLVVAFLGKGTRKFIVPSIETLAEQLPELKIPFKTRVKMLSTVFRDLVKDLEPIGDAIEFIADPDRKVLIARSSGDLAEAEIELSEETGALLEFESEEESRAMYTVDYLSDIVGAAQAANEVVFEFGTAIPCKIEYILPQEGRLTFYVAPRTE